MILHYIEVAVVFLTILSVLVATHEFGHYIFARAFKMGVEEFSIGMFGGKPLVTYLRRKYRIKILPGEDPSFDRRPEGFSLESGGDNFESVLIETPDGPVLEETTSFTIRPVPIGGFVRIKGMLPSPDGSEVHVPGGFYSKPPWQRFLVLLAGPMFSVVAGVVVMIPIFMEIGAIKANPEPVIGTVNEGPAANAGLRTYDRILSIDGVKIDNFYQIITKVQGSPGVPLKLTYSRNGQISTTTVVPTLSPVPTNILGPDLEVTGEFSRHGLLEIAPLERRVRLSFLGATVEAIRLPITSVKGLVGIVKRPSTAKSAVGGPGMMIDMTSQAVNEGTVDVIYVAALISISVGIFNLLPVHPLDGGQMVVALAEMLRGGRRLSMKVQNVVGAMGLATVLLLVVCALSVDAGRFRSGPPKLPKVVSQQKEDR
jgi:regulator of sigma E protease